MLTLQLLLFDRDVTRNYLITCIFNSILLKYNILLNALHLII